MSHFRRCSHPGCNRPAVATMTYAHAESTAVVAPLAPTTDPHAWDLCAVHAARIKAPVGWELLRVGDVNIEDEDDFTALLDAVRHASGTNPEDFSLKGGSRAPSQRGGKSSATAPGETPQRPSPATRAAQQRPVSGLMQDPGDPRDVPNHPVWRRQRRRAHLRVVEDLPGEQ